jgi:cysteinyl-tRNA synthetase
MELKLYDTLTREKRVFRPLDPAHVRMYVCGPTVYDYAHIGNARPVIVFDVLFRLLRHLYGAEHVTYVRNITDVDDKINARAAEEYPDLPLNEAIRKVTEKTDKQFHEDVAALGCLPPTVEPRATEHIAEMRTVIERLIKSGNAYVADDHVLFSVPSMPDYGRLSKRPLDEMIAGARVEVAPYKRDPQDFVLWKPSKPGEPAWPSPAGIKTPGRPGWHIECSAMSWKYLGEVFDIHGGGIDLVFPHHENEIAQSRYAFHTPVMANFWMHNGFLQVEGEKMSKSLGNFVTIRELLEDWPGGAIRLAMLQTHYRQPVSWTANKLHEAKEELGDWVAPLYNSRGEHELFRRRAFNRPAIFSLGFVDALSDDLNTPEAITYLRNLYSERSNEEKYAELIENCEALGIFTGKNIAAYGHGISGSVKPGALNQNYELVEKIKAAVANNNSAFISSAETQLRRDGIKLDVAHDGYVTLDMHRSTGPDEIERLIAARNAARKAKDFEKSDRIRDELAKMGVVLKDTKDGTTWEIVR